MDNEIRQKILDMVHSRPTAISEIAIGIKKNWRTADRYVDQMVSEDLIKVHVFREGSRGSLKLAYWPTSLKESPSAVKNLLLQKILNGRKKEDFSPLEIVQNVSEKNRSVYYISPDSYNKDENVDDFFNSLRKAKSQILFFSGNLSFTNMGDRYNEFCNILDKKLSEGVNIFVLSRVDTSNKKIIRELLQLNNKNHKGKFEIRYAHQPMRCTIIDDTQSTYKEKFFRYSEDNPIDLGEPGTYIYKINDSDWTNWITNCFWYIWRGSIEAEKRLAVLEQTIKA